MIDENIKKVVNEVMSFPNPMNLPWPDSPGIFNNRIPTLAPGIYWESSPMLKKRFEIYGRWVRGTDGIWLSIEDMELLWGDSCEKIIVDIKLGLGADLRGWNDHIHALFKDERISVFAHSDNNYEAIYLLWLENEEEPELWVYNGNGESRYKNLDDYLVAYLNDDLSASERSWRA